MAGKKKQKRGGKNTDEGKKSGNGYRHGDRQIQEIKRKKVHFL